MRVLLAHYNDASDDALIARAIAFGIEEQTSNMSVDVAPMSASSGLGRYDGFVIGTNLANGRWPDVAQRFLDQNAATLADMPTAIYLALTGPMDPETRSLARSAVATDQVKQFVARRMPMGIGPEHIRGIGLFMPLKTASTSLLVRTINAIYTRLFRRSPEDEEYARAGRSFGKRVGARFDKDRA